MLVWALMLVLAGAGCKKDNEDQEVTVKFDTFVLNYEVLSDWVEYSYRVRIDQYGIMNVYETYGMAGINRENRYVLTKDETTALAQRLQKLSEVKLKSQYGFRDDKAVDLPVTKLKYTTNLGADSTMMYSPEEGELPNELQGLLDNLSVLLNYNNSK